MCECVCVCVLACKSRGVWVHTHPEIFFKIRGSEIASAFCGKLNLRWLVRQGFGTSKVRKVHPPTLLWIMNEVVSGLRY